MFNQMFDLLEIQEPITKQDFLAVHCNQELIIVHAFGISNLRLFKKVNSLWKRCQGLLVYLLKKCIKNILHS